MLIEIRRCKMNPIPAQKTDYKIMLVDDEPDILDLLEKALNIEGYYNIIKIEDGQTAVQLCRRTSPDIIILDVMLPDLDGYEVCRQIRAFSHCPILFLSSKNDELDKILGLSVGGDDYVGHGAPDGRDRCCLHGPSGSASGRF
ncbi:response regulator [Duncaniella muris]|uniref:response regulator n=1 Tax=Duncaniella muris TaxID=2094150 RepID=UPI00336BB0D9